MQHMTQALCCLMMLPELLRDDTYRSSRTAHASQLSIFSHVPMLRWAALSFGTGQAGRHSLCRDLCNAARWSRPVRRPAEPLVRISIQQRCGEPKEPAAGLAMRVSVRHAVDDAAQLITSGVCAGQRPRSTADRYAHLSCPPCMPSCALPLPFRRVALSNSRRCLLPPLPFLSTPRRLTLKGRAEVSVSDGGGGGEERAAEEGNDGEEQGGGDEGRECDGGKEGQEGCEAGDGPGKGGREQACLFR